MSSIYETTSGNAYAGDDFYDNLSGYVTRTYQSEWTDIHGNLWRKTCTVINLGRADAVTPVDPDAQMQGEKLWSKQMGNQQSALAFNLAAGEARFVERRDKIANFLRTFGPATADEIAQEVDMLKSLVAEMIRRDAGATFYRVGKMPGSGGAYIWGLKEGA